MELADTSAWPASRRNAFVRGQFDARVINGDIATAPMVKLELLHSARNPREFAEMRAELDALPDCPIGEDEWLRALDVYEELCRRGPGNDAHRSVNHPHLLVAAAAEHARVPLLHYDHHFEAIAAVTGQPTRWLAPRGSL